MKIYDRRCRCRKVHKRTHKNDNHFNPQLALHLHEHDKSSATHLRTATRTNREERKKIIHSFNL